MAAHRRLCASRLSAVGFLVAAAHGQVLSTTVDILSPGDEGYDGIPENRLVLDVFTDIAITDMWVSAGLRVVTSEGAVLQYHDTDLNTPELEAGLFNPGLENRFVTSLSRPSRPRDSSWRFTNAGAAAAGAYVPAAPIPVTRSDELNVAYFMSPPDFFRDDGYIARISVDLSATEFSPEELVVTYSEPAFWIVACDVPGSSMTGLVQSTFDFPHPPGTGGIDFWVTVPEPAGVAFWLCGVAICRRRRM